MNTATKAFLLALPVSYAINTLVILSFTKGLDIPIQPGLVGFTGAAIGFITFSLTFRFFQAKGSEKPALCAFQRTVAGARQVTSQRDPVGKRQTNA
jgi:hypothetical protein